MHKYEPGDMVRISNYKGGYYPIEHETPFKIGDECPISECSQIMSGEPTYKLVGDNDCWYWGESELELISKAVSFDGLEELL